MISRGHRPQPPATCNARRGLDSPPFVSYTPRPLLQSHEAPAGKAGRGTRASGSRPGSDGYVPRLHDAADRGAGEAATKAPRTPHVGPPQLAWGYGEKSTQTMAFLAARGNRRSIGERAATPSSGPPREGARQAISWTS